MNTYRPHEFAELLGVSVRTLRRWDRENILTAHRTPTGMRYYTYDQHLWFKGNEGAKDTRQTVIYSRVLSRGQKDDLLNRSKFLREFCNARGIIVDRCIEEYGSGMNYKRKEWNKHLDDVMDRNVKQIIIAHRDRFVRFGFS